MKATKLLIVVVALALVASAGFCQSARVLGMGGTFVANPDGAFTAAGNPANLPNAGIPAQDGAKWGWQGAASGTFSSNVGMPYESGGSTKVKAYDVFLGSQQAGEDAMWGWGIGWAQEKVDPTKATEFVGGVGSKIMTEGLQGLSWGVSIAHAKFEPGISEFNDVSKTFGNIGLTYDIEIADRAPIKLGLLVSDVTNQTENEYGESVFGGFGGRTWSAGASFHVTPKLLFAVDLVGIGSPSKRAWQMGAEYRQDEWAVRAGDADGMLTLGAGWCSNDGRWFIDYAHAQKEGSKTNLVSAGFNF